MKKTKKILIITILLSILISIFAIKSLYVEAADVKRTLTESSGQRPYINISEWDIVCSSNIYCVAHAQNLNESSAKFTVLSKAEIRGDQATFKQYNANGSVSKTGSTTSSLNHKMAAVLNHAGYADSTNMTGYGDAERYNNGVTNRSSYSPSQVQIAVWYGWNDWVATIPEGYSFAAGDLNLWVDQFGHSGQVEYWNKFVNGMQSTKTYHADIYYLEHLNGNNYQELILVNTEVVDNTIDIPVTKVWEDNDNSYGVRPSSVTVNLKNGSTTVKTATLNSSNDWKYTFEDVEANKTYTVEEVAHNGYDSKVTGTQGTGFTITNTLNKITVNVTKTWLDSADTSMKPSQVKVDLYKNNTKSSESITLNASNSWKGSFADLPKYDSSGTAITYSVKESSVPTGYTSAVTGNQDDGFTIRNTLQTVNVTVKKEWADYENFDRLRPSEVKVRLKKDGTVVENSERILKANNKGLWDSYTWEGLPEYTKGANGAIKKAVYSVEEVEVPKGYRVSYNKNNGQDNDWIITNSHSPAVDVEFIKTWNDDYNRDGIRTESVEIKILENGQDKGKRFTLYAPNWQGKLEGLPRADNAGNSINYTFEEIVPAGYTSTLSTTLIEDNAGKFSFSENNENMSIDKSDDTLVRIDTALGIEPGKVVDHLSKNESHYRYTNYVSLYNSANGTWRSEADVMKPIGTYGSAGAMNCTGFVACVLQACGADLNLIRNCGYESTVGGAANGYRWLKWIQDNSIECYTFNTVEALLASGKAQKGDIIFFNPEDRDAYGADCHIGFFWGDNSSDNKFWHSLGTQNDITTIQTKWDKSVIYLFKTTNLVGEVTITNTHIPEKTNITVRKEWNDLDDLDEYRPSSITVRLKADGANVTKDITGTDVVTVTLNESNNWSYTWENLYKYKHHGQEIDYTVEETQITEYNAPVYEKETKKEGNTNVISIKITNTHTPHYDGYYEINGTVWVDGSGAKGNEIDGKFDTSNGVDRGLAGVKVTLRRSNGNQFDTTSYATTDANGNYTIKVNYDNSKKVYKLYEEVNKVRDALKTAYIEFEYNGKMYTTVAKSNEGNNTSKAVEDSNKRLNFDNKYNTTDVNTKKSDEWTDKMLTASTEGILNTFSSIATTETRNEIVKYCNGDSTYIRTNPKGAWNQVLTGQKDLLTHPDHKGVDCNANGHTLRTFGVQVIKINNINLGLFERELPEIAIFEDINNVEVEMQGQSYKYLYNVKSDKYADSAIKAKFQNKDTYTYRRPVNPADIAYIQEDANSNLMKAYITYDVKLGNLSTTLKIKVNKIVNAYDPNYTLKSITINGTEKTIGTVTNKNGFNTIDISDLDINLEAGYESDTTQVIQLKYEISTEAIRGLINGQATLNNAVEILSYTSYYGENTLYAEQQKNGRTGNVYGGRNDNEQPGNANFYINEDSRIAAVNDEYDTDIAPSFVLCIDNEYYKTLSGTVWEDTDANTDDNERLGNGKQDENTKNVSGVKVELYQVKEDGTTELAKLYKINTTTSAVETKPAFIHTDENGNYSLGTDGYSVVTDKYLIKYTYGEGTEILNSSVSARDYKSTILTSESGTLYDVYKGTSTSDEWHLDLNQDVNYSIAVDNVDLRLNTENALIYSNYNTAMTMDAYSKTFEMQLEFDIDTDANRYEEKVGEDGKTRYGNNLSVFDFGIIERPREDLLVETSIADLKVTLANGQVLTEGNAKSDKLSYVKAVGFKQQISNGEQARNGLDKQAIIEIDSELIQGASIDVKYEIKVTNNSEIDYDYSEGTEYYYYGTNVEGAKVITNSINKLVYYMDKDLVWTVDNANWTEKSSDELFNEGLISAKTQEAITNKYIPFVTEQFKGISPLEGENVKTDYMSAKRMLANSKEHTFDNQAEILEVEAKIARTIDSINTNGVPQVKEYKMGNYVPSTVTRKVNRDINEEKAGLHEQDDDRVKIVITPPTGLVTYIINYSVIALIALTVIATVIIFIKKRTLSK